MSNLIPQQKKSRPIKGGFFSFLLLLTIFLLLPFSTANAAFFGNWKENYTVMVPAGYHIHNFNDYVAFSSPSKNISHTIRWNHIQETPFHLRSKKEQGEIIKAQYQEVGEEDIIHEIVFVPVSETLGIQFVGKPKGQQALAFTYVIYENRLYYITTKKTEFTTFNELQQTHNQFLNSVHFTDFLSTLDNN